MRLQLVERNAFAARELLAAASDRCASARDSIQYLDDRPPVDLGIVDRSREERAGERAFSRMRLLGHPPQPRSVLLVEEDVDPVGTSASRHNHHSSTIRHNLCLMRGYLVEVALIAIRWRSTLSPDPRMSDDLGDCGLFAVE